MSDVNVSFTPSELAMIVGFVLPAITALLTKLHASEKVKAIVNIALSVVAGFFATAVAGDVYNLGTLGRAMGITFVMSVASYLGFQRPTGIAPAIQAKTENFGVGKPVV